MGGSIQVSGGDRIIDWKLGGIRNMHIGSGSTVTIETNTTFLDWEGTIGGPYVALTTNIDTSVSQTLEFVNGMLVTPY